MLRILFINPPYARFMGTGNSQFPLSFGSMATILSKNNFEVGIYDADFDENFIGCTISYESSFLSQHKIPKAASEKHHHVWLEIERVLSDFQPNVVAITSMTNKFPMTSRIASIAKQMNEDTKVVIGGHHSSIFGPKLLMDRNIDYAVIGEGELTFLELAQSLNGGTPSVSHIKGLVYKEREEIVVNPPREFISDLDLLPIADRSLILNTNYVSQNNIMTSRGCPFNCSYCGAQVIWGPKVRWQRVEKVIEEIKYLLSVSNSRSISFWDDSFTANKSYLKALLKEVELQGISFNCITRLDLVNDDILKDLKKAGCNSILFGIESGRDAILEAMDKRMNRGFIKNQIRMVADLGISWTGFFMMGYPGETKEDMLATLEFMQELNPDYAEINLFNPLPGTPIWQELEARGKVSPDMDFCKFSQASTNNFYVEEGITRGDFIQLALHIARAFDSHNKKRARTHFIRKTLSPISNFLK